MSAQKRVLWIASTFSIGMLPLNELKFAVAVIETLTPKEAREKIEEFRKAGVKHLMLINIGPDPKYVLKTYIEKIAPSFA